MVGETKEWDIKAIHSASSAAPSGAAGDDYVVKLTALKPNPIPPGSRKSRAGIIALGAVLVVALCAGALLIRRSSSPHEPGLREELTGRLEAIEPSSMQTKREFYTAAGDCKPSLPCPAVTRWYSITGPVGAARDAAIEQLREEGLEFRRPATFEPNLIVANDNKDYIYFLVFHEPPLDGPLDRTLPPHIEADLTVAVVPKDIGQSKN